ncbi:uncharacterized protein LOC127594086 isoform X7 [Hippocampus zosterae]|uniref:uncharacterized protein LOC127594086 isoform X7 n=1 Tax=Hippocampus zosterae TaxID=109293 RepID=UPI00223E1615|nr:uncharacterized protein LOC127594086 isoform X7 [Hippocampus zosterae]
MRRRRPLIQERCLRVGCWLSACKSGDVLCKAFYFSLPGEVSLCDSSAGLTRGPETKMRLPIASSQVLDDSRRLVKGTQEKGHRLTAHFWRETSQGDVQPLPRASDWTSLNTNRSRRSVLVTKVQTPRWHQLEASQQSKKKMF